MIILSVDTSCDETSVAVLQGRRVISHIEFTQINLHATWGGVVPNIAKRAHEDRIDAVVDKVIARATRTAGIMKKDIQAVAVTVGPGLAIALEVGIRKAKQIATHLKIPLIPVNHMSGHIYSCFTHNAKGNPDREFNFPYIALLASGGHTELVHFIGHHQFDIVGQTRDDAVGESLDKAARILGFGYPGGPMIERLSQQVNNTDKYQFPRPMISMDNMDFSYSGLKTSFLYHVQKMTEVEKNSMLPYLASSFQEAAFEPLVAKSKKAMKKYSVHNLLVSGGVAINTRLRYLVRSMVKEIKGSVYFPPYRYLNMDNAAMIGVSAYYSNKKLTSNHEIESVDRIPRLMLNE